MSHSSKRFPLSFRQAELRRLLAEVGTLNDQESLAVLQAQWVHRYGIETLPRVCARDTASSQDLAVDELDLIERKTLDKAMIAQDERSIGDQNQNPHEPRSFSKDEFQLEAEISLSSSSRHEDATLPPPSPALSHLRRWLPKAS